MEQKEERIMNSLKITSDLAELDKIRDFLKETLQHLNITDKDYFKIELSLLEVCINIILYAYPREKGDILLKAWRQEGKMFLEIRDSGIPFDPKKLKVPDIEEIIKQERKGGLGVYISRTFMDGFDYKREDNQNVLVIYKQIEKTEPSG
jgi:serine/threonine-protein kinase RsbW